MDAQRSLKCWVATRVWMMRKWAVHLADLLAWSQTEAAVAPGRARVVRHVRGGKDVSGLVAQVSVVLLGDLELLGCCRA